MNKPLFHRLFQIHFLELPEYRLPRFLSFPSFFYGSANCLILMLRLLSLKEVCFHFPSILNRFQPRSLKEKDDVETRLGIISLVVWKYVCPRCITANHQTTIMPHTLCQFHFYITYALMLASQLYPIFFRSVHNVYCACWIHALLLNADRL